MMKKRPNLYSIPEHRTFTSDKSTQRTGNKACDKKATTLAPDDTLPKPTGEQTRTLIGWFTGGQKNSGTALLRSLRVLARLRENDRISTASEIALDKKIFFQPLRRWYNSENRVANIAVIEDVVARTLQWCRKLKVVSNSSNAVSSRQATEMLDRVVSELVGALDGVRNLCVTYADDAYICARINILCDCCQDELLSIDVSDQ